MKHGYLAAMVLASMLFGVAGAAPIITVGSHDLQENAPGQTIGLYVAGVEQVTGFNLRAQIGDGTGTDPEPVFETVSFAGGIWDAYAFAATGGPISGAEQFAQASVAFNTSVEVPANGLLLTLTIDTSGFFSGQSFSLMLAGTEMGVDSDFLVIGGNTLAPQITNGVIQIVPEPASFALLSLAGLLVYRRKR